MAVPPDDDPYADEPDRWEEADQAWRAKWSDETATEGEEPPVEPPPVGYRSRKSTPGQIHDAYGEGMREAGPYLGLGAQIGGSMVVFVGLGLLADRWLDTSPWGVLVGAALGLIGIVALVIRISNDASGKK